jgi:hypothetical protein
MSKNEARAIDVPKQEYNSRILAALFCLYGCSHLVVLAFTWTVFLALARSGYSDVLRELKTLTLLGVTLSGVALPLLSGYALLRKRSWAGGIACLTCLAILIMTFIVLRQIARPRLSTNRIIFGALYAGSNLALSTYAGWFVNKLRHDRWLSWSKT